jgi:predicted transcriptional regulator of viral defense system
MLLVNPYMGNYMKIKNTILSQKDLDLLESIVLRYGKVVSFEQIHKGMGENATVGAVRKHVAQMSKAGWLIRLKRGLYLVVTDISTLGIVDVSDLVISQTLNDESYISFESALQYHGMFDQLLKRIDAVTTRTTKSYKVQQTTYTFAKIKEALYFGFTNETINNQKVNIAEQEKALLDILYFRSTDYAVSLVLEKLRNYEEEIDFAKLKTYSTKFSLGIVRKVGYLLDLVGVDTADLLTDEVKKNSYNKLTQNADQFNAKWRLYYDSHLTR